MNASTQRVLLTGPAGVIDCALDLPSGPVRGVAVIAHPHPLFGGTRDNKVVQTLARALLAEGYLCWRPDFRGVGGSQGTHDEGRGETEDLLAVADQALAHPSAGGHSDLPLVLAGFSFGSFVQTRVAQALTARGQAPERLILIGPAVSRFEVGEVPAGTVVIHGEQDDVVPLSAVLDWARPQQLPVVVLPGTDHFFHHRLPQLKSLVRSALHSTVTDR
jgi:alpha/beta superfamily hydrolase